MIYDKYITFTHRQTFIYICFTKYYQQIHVLEAISKN